VELYCQSLKDTPLPNGLVLRMHHAELPFLYTFASKVRNDQQSFWDKVIYCHTSEVIHNVFKIYETGGR
jgi:hypothetical protein